MQTHEQTLEEHLQEHYIHKSNWLRAAVLGANDGVISISSLAIGVAAASTTNTPVILATLAGLVAGAISMAAGEYVSVSSQTDIEHADILREKQELEDAPELEFRRLVEIYTRRWISKETATIVAHELTDHDVLAAHVRDELGITESSQARPGQAAWASGCAFVCGGALPMIIALFTPMQFMTYALYVSALASLIILWTVSARTGGASAKKAILRVVFWGTAAMFLTAFVGYLFGVSVG